MYKYVLLIGLLFSTDVYAGQKPHLSFGPDVSYREIGEYDSDLSMLCGERLFGQRVHSKLRAYFERGGIILGAAKGTGWNLIDRTNARKPEFDYWFKNDGYSGCEVYKSNSGRAASQAK